MIQVLVQIATHAAALLLYPGLVATVLFGAAVETIWVRVSDGRWVLPDVRWRPPSAVLPSLYLFAVSASRLTARALHPPPSASPKRHHPPPPTRSTPSHAPTPRPTPSP